MNFRFVFLMVFFCTLASSIVFAQNLPESFGRVNLELFNAATREDFGLMGPVATVLDESFSVDPNETPSVVSTASLSGSQYFPERYAFNLEGYLIEAQKLGETNEPFVKYFYKYDGKGFYQGFKSISWDGATQTFIPSQGNGYSPELLRTQLDPSTVSILFNNLKYQYFYNENNKLQLEEKFTSTNEISNKVIYQYNGDNQLVKQFNIDYLVGGEPRQTARIVYDYDKNRLIKVTEFNSQSVEVEVTQYFYDEEGQLSLKQKSRYDGSSSIEVYQANKLEERLEFKNQLVYHRETYDFDSEKKLISYKNYSVGRDTFKLNHFCSFDGYDVYGNWTEKKCVFINSGEILEQKLNPFDGFLVKRTFTYFSKD